MIVIMDNMITCILGQIVVVVFFNLDFPELQAPSNRTMATPKVSCCLPPI